jgi:ATP-dependent DNA helicase RecG
VLEKFAAEDLIRERHGAYEITHLGAILFAKNLTEFDVTISRKAVRTIVFDGPGKLRTLRDITGQKGYAVGFKRLIDFLDTLLPAHEILGQALRETVRLYPPVAIRELVANAIIHQDFEESGTSVVIEIFSDRIEISNPGAPFVPTDRFIDGYKSRNERLADLMRRFRICEEQGSGIDKVIDSIELFQLPAPDFRGGSGRTSAVLFAPIPFQIMDRTDRIRASYQHCCLRYVFNQKMTNETLRERFKLTDKQAETASRIIRDTIDQGLIKPETSENPSRRYMSYVPHWA